MLPFSQQIWYNKDMEQKEKQIKIKCDSCGASLTLNEKKCSYCGCINPNFKPSEIKQIVPQNHVYKQKSVLKGLWGNVFEDILQKFDED